VQFEVKFAAPADGKPALEISMDAILLRSSIVHAPGVNECPRDWDAIVDIAFCIEYLTAQSPFWQVSTGKYKGYAKPPI
jgi:hypothetical protein